MSLYDDLVVDNDNNDNQRDGWSKSSGIRLLHEHLQNKKVQQNQNKRETARKANPSLHHISAIVAQNKPKSLSEDLCPPAITAINISYVGKESKGSLLGGDWDISEEYDPIWPNDYEKIMKDRKDKKDREKELERNRELEERDRRRRERFERTVAPNRSLGLDYDDDEEEEEEEDKQTDGTKSRDKDKDRTRGTGAMIAPPASLLESCDNPSNTNTNFGVSSVAAKIMARMGYKEGQGLGREEQGMSTALLVEKTSKRGGKIIHEKDGANSSPLMPPPPPPLVGTQSSSTGGTGSSANSPNANNSPNSSEGPTESITEIMKNPSKVVLLRNMVGPGEVDDLLEPETKEECGKYGEVVKCVIFELTGLVSDEEAVRIFVEFKRVESAIKAVVDLNGRYFGGRIVRAHFYDIEKFKKLELKD